MRLYKINPGNILAGVPISRMIGFSKSAFSRSIKKNNTTTWDELHRNNWLLQYHRMRVNLFPEDSPEERESTAYIAEKGGTS